MEVTEETVEGDISSYKKPEESVDWKTWKKERKKKRKIWNEQKLLKQIEKQNKKACVEVEVKTNDQTDQVNQDDGGRKYTVSIALPGSILDNAQSAEFRTYVAGQIARAAVIFNVDEIVIFDELSTTAPQGESSDGYHAVGKKGRANVQMGRILQYLECPQYLRKQLFSIQKDLEYAGLLNPLDCFHHFREKDRTIFREGVILNKPVRDGKGSFVGVGTRHEVQVDKLLPPGTRVTVKIDEDSMFQKRWRGQVVSPSSPRETAGLYWGYNVRLVDSLSDAIKDKYDLVIGTSERGDSVDDIMELPHFNNLIVVFGGLKGLEASIDADLSIKTDNPKEIFNLYLNTCPDQGSRTIRTEEAIPITMTVLRPLIKRANS